MKSVEEYILEKQNFIFGGKSGLSGKEYGQQYNYFPKDRDELRELIKKLIKERGEDADFNDIDTSYITNMYAIFYNSKFNGDISNWDTSNVTDMSHMFRDAKSFNQYISDWDTSNVTEMCAMFASAESFNQDISGWDTGKVINMSYMFHTAECFNQDISSWDVSNTVKTEYMFENCPIKEEYKPKFK